MPAAYGGTLVGHADAFQTSCGLLNSPDDAVSFTAPSAGTYKFQAVGTYYSYAMMAVEVRDGGCNGAQPYNLTIR